MQIIVLAGGDGKRMWPIGQEKYLLPFLGQPLLYYTLKRIKDAVNFDEAVIVTKESSKGQISKIASNLGLNYKIAIQGESKGMADAVLSAKQLIDSEILVINAEDVLDENIYQDVLTTAVDTQADVVLSGLRVGKYFPGGYLKVTGDKVEGIVEKPGEGSEPSDLVKLVVDYFKDGKKLLQNLKSSQSEKDDIYEMALVKMIEEGADVKFSPYEGAWIPLKYPWHILDITEYLLSKIKRNISPKARISEKAIIEGDVIVEEGTKVFEGAIIKGPCYIGKNCIVGNNSMVRESNLEEGCVTGFSSDITRSYIGANSWFHTNYVGDSCLEGDFGMGSGAVLANLRLDDRTIMVGEDRIDTGRHKLGLMAGTGVRVGVNASTMPGVMVGAGSLIGPGVTLKKDLPENKKITTKEESYEIRDYHTTHTGYDQFRDKIK